MKKLFLIPLILISCARFSTKQTDNSYYDKQSKPCRLIITKATAFTLFTSKSDLATWTATQTDKSQGAKVGGLTLQSSSPIDTNLATVIGLGVGTAVKAMAKP